MRTTEVGESCRAHQTIHIYALTERLSYPVQHVLRNARTAIRDFDDSFVHLDLDNLAAVLQSAEKTFTRPGSDCGIVSGVLSSCAIRIAQARIKIE
jgi:hypothetical protein